MTVRLNLIHINYNELKKINIHSLYIHNTHIHRGMVWFQLVNCKYQNKSLLKNNSKRTTQMCYLVDSGDPLSVNLATELRSSFRTETERCTYRYS